MACRSPPRSSHIASATQICGLCSRQRQHVQEVQVQSCERLHSHADLRVGIVRLSGLWRVQMATVTALDNAINQHLSNLKATLAPLAVA